MKMKIGNLVIDAVLKTDHTTSLLITDHPVEKGSDITDHAQKQPKQLTIEIGFTDSGMMYGEGRNGRSVNAYQALVAIQESREPFPLSTRLFNYKNMLIESINAGDDYTTMNALKATLTLREVIIVDTATVGVTGRSSDPQTTDSTNSGSQQSSSVDSSGGAKNSSILNSIANTIRGGN